MEAPCPPAATSGARSARAEPAGTRSRRRMLLLPVTALAGILTGALVTRALLRHPQAAAFEFVPFAIESDSGFPPHGAPAISPDGRSIVYEMVGAGGARLYLRRVDELAAHPLPGTEGGEKPFFSPDGEWVAFHAEGLIKKTRPDGGEPTVVATVPRGQFSAGWWGADDVIVYSVRYYGDLYRVPASGGVTSRVFAGDTTGRIADAHPLPHGHAALVTVTRDWNAARIGVLDLGTGRLRQLDPGMELHGAMRRTVARRSVVRHGRAQARCAGEEQRDREFHDWLANEGRWSRHSGGMP